jgi:hypothetical protein
MSAALDQDARNALEHFVQRARRLLEGDLAREAEGRFGIHLSDGHVEDEDGLNLDPTALNARRDVVEILDFLRREESSNVDAVARLIREAAFTHLNRLIAIRIAEAMALLPESLANGPSSAGFRELLEVAPLLSHDASGGYWLYLQLCGDELAAELPQLFDPRNPLLELAPSSAAFDELVDMIITSDLIAVWDAPDALGWTYQFFNSGDERRAMRDASVSPRNSRELAVRNQFFTPRYVVDFLVHNTLGRRLLEANPDSGLANDLTLLLDPPEEQGAPLDLIDVRVLDPACGSGHFLLGAYDVLERAWELQGVSPEDAAPHIVSSLWGIDIDARCAQVASAAVILRARKHCKNHQLPIPNIITARALPEPPEGWPALLASLPEDRRQLVRAMRDALDQAPLLGPLLRVEELLATEIRAHVAGASADPSTLFSLAGVANDAFGQAEVDVLRVLQGIADRTTSGPAERLFAAESNDAIRFVEAMRHRYHAVLMNPPFGEPVPESKDYLKAAYPWLPWKDYNLFAIFVGRGLELCDDEASVGAITSRVGLFLKTYQAWREQVLLANEMTSLVDLGLGVMEQALVEAAAYTIRRSSVESPGTYIRMLGETNRPVALTRLARIARAHEPDENIFRASRGDFTSVEGAPISYWLSDSIRRLFRDFPRIEERAADIRQGLATGDDFRFVRAAWEVLPRKIAIDARSTENTPWVTFAKGGDYSPYWADLHLVVKWGNSGEVMRGSPASRIQNSSYLGRGGLTWPTRTASGFGPRVLPRGAAFANKGNGIFPAAEVDPLVLLGWLTSRVSQAALDSMVAAADSTSSGGAAKSYEVGLIQKLPWPIDLLNKNQLAILMKEVVDIRRSGDVTDETTASFVSIGLPVRNSTLSDVVICRINEEEDRALRILEVTSEVENSIATDIGLDDAGRHYLDKEVGPHPSSYRSELRDQSQFVRQYESRIDVAISELIKERGGSRAIANLTYFANRRIEVLAHGLEVNPVILVSERRRLGLVPPEEPGRTASDILSYLVGLAFGRWDLRMAFDPSSVHALGDPFEPRPACAPGMLVGVDGLPVNSSPPDYPLRLPLNGLLLDEPGHIWDIEDALTASAEALFGSAEPMVSDVIDALGNRSIRAYMRSTFFKEHLARYSKSRRKAPIYWPLTVPSGGWGVWVYAPQLSRETLYSVASEALRRERYADAEITRLERERASGAAARGAKTLDKALDEERKLAEELRRFRQEADRVAGLGWEPDLDDGIVICAAPLADLFPLWKEPAEYRKELRAGKYDWSTVSTWADQL